MNKFIVGDPKGLFNEKEGVQRINLDFYNIYCLKLYSGLFYASN